MLRECIRTCEWWNVCGVGSRIPSYKCLQSVHFYEKIEKKSFVKVEGGNFILFFNMGKCYKC